VHILIDDHRLTAKIDTGSRGTAIFRHAATQLGVTDAALAADRHIKLNGIGPAKIDAIIHVFASISIGDLTLKNVPVAIINDRKIDQTDVLLGADFQQKIHLWISNSTHTLVMQYPPQPSPNLNK
jgi:predicted aspartyl protease